MFCYCCLHSNNNFRVKDLKFILCFLVGIKIAKILYDDCMMQNETKTLSFI